MMFFTSLNNFIISSKESEQCQQDSNSCIELKFPVPCKVYNSAEQTNFDACHPYINYVSPHLPGQQCTLGA